MIHAIKYNDILEAKRTIKLDLIKKEINQDEIKYITFDKKNNDLWTELNQIDIFDVTKATIVYSCDFLSSLKDFNDNRELIEMMNNNDIPQEVYLLTDAKFLSNKEFKTLTSNFQFTEQKEMNSTEKQNLVNNLLAQYNIHLDKEVYATLLANLSCNYGVIKNEIEKLNNGIKAGLNNDQLKELICNYNEEVIFELLNSLLLGKQALAWKIYQDLIRHRQDEISIINAMSTQLYNLYNGLTLLKQNVPIEKIAEVTGVASYVINKVYKNTFINYNIDKILSLILQLYQLEVDIKLQKVDQRLGFKQYILNI